MDIPHHVAAPFVRAAAPLTPLSTTRAGSSLTAVRQAKGLRTQEQQTLVADTARPAPSPSRRAASSPTVVQYSNRGISPKRTVTLSNLR